MTLIEVLVAAVILFTVFALASQAYSLLLHRIGKTSSLMGVFEYQDIINATISNSLHDGTVKGSFKIKNEVVSWNATVLSSGYNVGDYNELANTFDKGNHEIILYSVKVSFARAKFQNYQFERFVWLGKEE